MKIARKPTRQIRLGNLAIGGDAPVSVQMMTKTDTSDVDATVAQISEVQSLGCDIVRLAVPDGAAAGALDSICGRVDIPIVADIHFDHRLALIALDSGVKGLRINPGNIGGPEKVREVVVAARDRGAPIRIGVNSGSVESDLLENRLKETDVTEKLEFRPFEIKTRRIELSEDTAPERVLTGVGFF